MGQNQSDDVMFDRVRQVAAPVGDHAALTGSTSTIQIALFDVDDVRTVNEGSNLKRHWTELEHR